MYQKTKKPCRFLVRLLRRVMKASSLFSSPTKIQEHLLVDGESHRVTMEESPCKDGVSSQPYQHLRHQLREEDGYKKQAPMAVVGLAPVLHPLNTCRWWDATLVLDHIQASARKEARQNDHLTHAYHTHAWKSTSLRPSNLSCNSCQYTLPHLP